MLIYLITRYLRNKLQSTKIDRDQFNKVIKIHNYGNWGIICGTLSYELGKLYIRITTTT